MVKLKSTFACIIVLNAVVIKPQMNDFSETDYNKIKDHKDFKTLLKNGDLIILPSEDELEDVVEDQVETDPKKMKVADLRKYAEELGVEIPEGAKKDEIIKLIEMLNEE